jgi:hypothetical protein
MKGQRPGRFMGGLIRWFALIPCLLLLSCASSVNAPAGLLTVRQVIFLREPLSGTWDGEQQMLASLQAGATNRFSAQQAQGYVNIVFNNGNGHQLTLLIHRETGETVYSKEVAFGAHLGWSTRGVWTPFPIRGQLDPSRYVLDLTIDHLPAGSYSFTVE